MAHHAIDARSIDMEWWHYLLLTLCLVAILSTVAGVSSCMLSSMITQEERKDENN